MKRILIVEDSIVMQALLARCLEPLGATITIADNGENGYKLLSDEPFDLAIVDHGLPGEMSGGALVILMHDKGCRVPFVMVTGFAGYEIPMVARGIAETVIKKPFDYRALRALAKEILERP